MGENVALRVRGELDSKLDYIMSKQKHPPVLFSLVLIALESSFYIDHVRSRETFLWWPQSQLSYEMVERFEATTNERKGVLVCYSYDASITLQHTRGTRYGTQWPSPASEGKPYFYHTGA